MTVVRKLTCSMDSGMGGNDFDPWQPTTTTMTTTTATTIMMMMTTTCWQSKAKSSRFANRLQRQQPWGRCWMTELRWLNCRNVVPGIGGEGGDGGEDECDKDETAIVQHTRPTRAEQMQRVEEGEEEEEVERATDKTDALRRCSPELGKKKRLRNEWMFCLPR